MLNLMDIPNEKQVYQGMSGKVENDPRSWYWFLESGGWLWLALVVRIMAKVIKNDYVP